MSVSPDYVLRARLGQQFARAQPKIGPEYLDAGVQAIRAVQRDEGETIISLPTGQAKRAREVVEILGLTGIVLEGL